MTRKTAAAAVLSVALLGVSGWTLADDKDLFSTFTRPPNVLVILDSGGSTTMKLAPDPDPVTKGHLWADGDDPESKLFVEKQALTWFIDSFPSFVYGFSYSYKDDPYKIHYTNFLYRTPVALYDGTPANGLVRMGGTFDPWHNTAQDPYPAYPVRYGVDGLAEYIHQVDATHRIRSYICDTNGSKKPNRSGAPYFATAFDWTLVPAVIQSALQGNTDWSVVSTALGSPTLPIVYPDQGWEKALKNYIHGSGIPTAPPPAKAAWRFPATDYAMRIREIPEVKVGSNWVADPDPALPARTVALSFVRDFVMFDRMTDGDERQQINSSPTLSALSWKTAGVDCNSGYMLHPDSPSNVPIPRVPIPEPAGDNCTATDNRDWMRSFLGKQTMPVFYFPNAPAANWLPEHKTAYMPWTETVIAGGRRPISKLLNDADSYYDDRILNRTGECARCRQGFVLLLTDGLETCASSTAPCQQGKNMSVPVFVVAVLPADWESRDEYRGAAAQLECITEPNGGDWVVASSADDIRRALAMFGRVIQERAAAFAAPSVPSVELSTREKGYISTFFAVRDRSIWEGHLRAYTVDPETGTIPLSRDPQDGLWKPDVSQALWDVGEPLSSITNTDIRSNTGGASGVRKFYWGINAASGVPGTRLAFESTGATATANDLTLWEKMMPSPPATAGTLSPAELTALQNAVGLVRGVRTDNVLYRYPYNPDNPAPTGRLGRLGDIFHSVPAITGRPDCYQCYRTNMHDYLDYYNQHFWRRKVLLMGANDGALHGVDAGFLTIDDDDNRTYDDGTGKELFAWVPTGVMTSRGLYYAATGTEQQYLVDGAPAIADVFIDPTHGGTPAAADRQWRTIALFGLRDGGRSISALDLTNPDPYTTGDPTSGPGRLPACLNGVADAGCGNRDYPSLLWEFTDSTVDGDNKPDLGRTWSKPVVTIVKVIGGAGTPEDRFVAVFGGGYEPPEDMVDHMAYGGDTLYVVDIETGRLLMKFHTGAPVPGEVGVLDNNLDGLAERVYWTDLSGSFWRLDLSGPSGNLAATLDGSGTVTCSGTTHTFTCGSSWTIQRVFQSTDGTYQPIFHRPAIIYIGSGAQQEAQYALAAGTGDRENILQLNAQPHRFYVIRDPGGTTGLPLTETDLVAVTQASGAATANYLFSDGVNSRFGWYLVLDPYEKVNTAAVGVMGMVIFSTFTPNASVIVIPPPEPGDPEVCRRLGSARTYVMNYTNANAVGDSRYQQFAENVLMASELLVYVGEDGRLHIGQSTDNMGFNQPIAPIAQQGNMIMWRER